MASTFLVLEFALRDLVIPFAQLENDTQREIENNGNDFKKKHSDRSFFVVLFCIYILTWKVSNKTAPIQISEQNVSLDFYMGIYFLRHKS